MTATKNTEVLNTNSEDTEYKISELKEKFKIQVSEEEVKEY
jgi:hypothetical protein